jgi:hypothetical protein
MRPSTGEFQRLDEQQNGGDYMYADKWHSRTGRLAAVR